MTEKAAFFDSLTDEQIGFFCAHEYDENVEDMLMDVLTAVQMNLYYRYEQSKGNNLLVEWNKSKPDILENTTPFSNVSFSGTSETASSDYHFNNELLEKLKNENNFVWLDIWRKGQIDSEMVDFDNWREEAMENYFFSLLSAKERGTFVSMFSEYQETNCVKTLSTDQQNIYTQWKEKTVPLIPPFLSALNLPANKKKLFLRLIENREFEALDSCMDNFPDFKEMYQWWRTAISKQGRSDDDNEFYVQRKGSSISQNILEVKIAETSTEDTLSDVGCKPDMSPDALIIITDSSRTQDKSAFLALLNDEQTKVFWDNLNNPELYDVMENHLNMNQYQKMLAAEKEIKSRRERNSETNKHVELDEESATPELQEQLEHFQQKAPNNLKLLLLGEAGVGKSTLINSCSNYVKHLTYKTAKDGKLQIWVPGSFTLLDDEMKSRDFPLVPSFQSKTVTNNRSVIAYEIPTDGGKCITFYDTAGFGTDSESTESEFDDELNFAKNGHYDAVLILLNPNVARLTQMLEIFLAKIVDSCPGNKIFFCFTNSQLTMYRFGETFSVLKAFLQKKKPELVEGLSQRSFCFENEAFKYLRVMKDKDFPLYEDQIRGLANSWKHSTEAMFKLMNSIIPEQTDIESVKPLPPVVPNKRPPQPSVSPEPKPKHPRFDDQKCEPILNNLSRDEGVRKSVDISPQTPLRPKSYAEAVYDNAPTLSEDFNKSSESSDWPAIAPLTPPVSIQSKLLTRRDPSYTVTRTNEFTGEEIWNNRNQQPSYPQTLNKNNFVESVQPPFNSQIPELMDNNGYLNMSNRSSNANSMLETVQDGRISKSRSDSYSEALSPIDGRDVNPRGKDALFFDHGRDSTTIWRPANENMELPQYYNQPMNNKNTGIMDSRHKKPTSSPFYFQLIYCFITAGFFAFIFIIYWFTAQ